MKKVLLMIIVIVASLAIKAQTVEGVIVTTPNASLQIAISDIKEILFTDSSLIIVKNDETETTFPTVDGWQLRFGDVETSSLSSVIAGESNGSAEIYNAAGVLMKVVKQASDLNLNELPKGTYIVKVQNVKFKVQR